MQGQSAKYIKDVKGELKEIGSECINSDPLHLGTLSCLKILYAFRDPPKYDQAKNRIVAGEAIRLRAKERDLFGYDALIVIAQKLWQEMRPVDRTKLIWHELYHFDVELDDGAQPCLDDSGRIKIKIRKHDLNIERFEAEIEKFGPDAEERVAMKRVSRLYKKTVVNKNVKG